MRKITDLSEKTILAKKVKAVEDALNISGKELARICGLSDTTIYRIDGRAMNDAAITEKTIHTICEKTGADSDWMLDLENEDSQPRFIADNMEKATDHGLCDRGQAVVQTPADRVRELRAGLRMSQVEFANYVGVSSGNIAAIETGRSRLTEQMAAKIEDRCEHGGAEWLLTGNTRNRDYPVSTEMIEWLKSNSKIRRDIWRMMQDEKDDA